MRRAQILLVFRTPLMTRSSLQSFLLVCALSTNLSASKLFAEVRLGSLFSDHAVLQQGKNVPIWGWAEPGEKIEVEFKGQKVSAEADAGGRWQANLAALAASSEPADLIVRSGEKVLTIHDVVVGEVWLCSGQSNMEFRVDQANDAAKEMAAADFPLIRQFRVPKSFKEKPVDDVTAQWTPANPKSVGMFSAAAFFFARDLYKDLKVPIGLINASFGGKMIETFMSPEAFADDPATPAVRKRWEDEQKRVPALMAAWEKAKAPAVAGPGGETASAESEAAPKRMNPSQVTEQHLPGCLFNGMLHPLIPSAIRGMLWYQGEHNIARAEEYQTLFPSFITDMRKKFGQGDFPFYYVQLANFDAPLDKSREGFAKLREVQRETLKLPNTGMAVTVDIGTAENIHPKNKQEVGLRLARWARANTYNLGDVVSGPLFKSAVRDGSALRVSFDYAKGGLVAPKDPVTSFEVAGADGTFHPAVAKIDGETLIVQSDEVKEPMAIRYAWTNAPIASLFNKEGLPASPFRYSLH